MLFQLKILFATVKSRRWLLTLVLVPPLLYLFLSALTPHEYTIELPFTGSMQSSLALGQTPLDTVNLATIVERPEILFTDNLVLMELREHLLTGHGAFPSEWAAWLPSRFAVFIKRSVLRDMSLRTEDESIFTLRYSGQDLALGSALVDFYAQYLAGAAARAEERSSLLPFPARQPQLSKGLAVPVVVSDTPHVTTKRSFLLGHRVKNAFFILLGSVLVLFGVIWIMEAVRPKLFSERQTARYLDVPVLGCMPNLDSLKHFHDRSKV